MKRLLLLALVILLAAMLPVATQARSGAGVIAAIGPTSAEPCQRPPDDYRRTTINGQIINVRTLWMLRLAAILYKGPGSPLRVVSSINPCTNRSCPTEPRNRPSRSIGR